MNALPTAVFLDRDGTIIEDRHYLADPDGVELLPGAAEAISRINALLIPAIVVTSQSGINRGYFTMDQYLAVERRLDKVLAAHGARIDKSYVCPCGPDEDCECRKPRTGLFLKAAAEHPEIDLARSLYIGDRMRDIEPGITLGGQPVLVPSPETSAEDVEKAQAVARVAPSLGAALDWFLCTN